MSNQMLNFLRDTFTKSYSLCIISSYIKWLENNIIETFKINFNRGFQHFFFTWERVILYYEDKNITILSVPHDENFPLEIHAFVVKVTGPFLKELL